MDKKHNFSKLNYRGAALFWIALVLAFVLLVASDEGMTWEIWGVLSIGISGFVFFIYSLWKYGKWLEEQEKEHNASSPE